MKTFILALQLMTRLPIHKEIEVTDERLIRGVMYWPLVGAVTGAIDCAVFAVLSFLVPKSVAAMFAVLCQLCVTGGFHLDGLCDTADAIYSARTRERMLEIMKDSRVGTNGVIAAIFDIGLKIVIVCQLDNPVLGLLLAPVAGKCIQGILMYKAVYPREKGLGHSYIGRIGAGILWVCLLSGVLIIDGGLAMTGHGWLLLLPAILALAAFGFRKYIEGKIGGMTGDTLGAGSEVIELLFLLGLMIGQRFGI